MHLPHSKELDHVIAESRDVAMRLDQSLTSAHLLLCLFTLKNRASMFLSDHRVTAERLLDALGKRPREDAETWPRILRRAQDVASVSGSSHVSSLHALVSQSLANAELACAAGCICSLLHWLPRLLPGGDCASESVETDEGGATSADQPEGHHPPERVRPLLAP